MRGKDENDEYRGPSKSTRKREADAAQDLGTRLIALKESDLVALDLPETQLDPHSSLVGPQVVAKHNESASCIAQPLDGGGDESPAASAGRHFDNLADIVTPAPTLAYDILPGRRNPEGQAGIFAQVGFECQAVEPAEPG